MSALAKIHGGLAHLFAAGVVVQMGLAGWGAFTTDHNQKYSDNNFGPHAVFGSLLVVVALVILVVALLGRWSAVATKLSAALLGLMVLQFILGVTGANDSPVFGALHGVNALVITGVAFLLVRGSRHGARAAVA